MKLEFENNIESVDLFNDLDFKSFLKVFDLNWKILPHKILHPMTADQGIAHFEILSALQKRINDGKLDLAGITAKTAQLPLLDDLLYHFETKCLEQHHLFSLGKFINAELGVAEYETACPIASPKALLRIRDTLTTYMRDDYTGMRYTDAQIDLHRRIEAKQKALNAVLSHYEETIHAETGLKMFYPYPKEISLDDDGLVRSAEACPLVTLFDKGNTVEVTFNLPEDISRQIHEKHQLSETFVKWMQDRLTQLNEALQPYCEDFIRYYEKRKSRAYLYTLLWACETKGLCIPEFSTSCECTFQGAELPILQQHNKRYVPLDISLKKGANVLFGANMTGKTSVLKTLYFQLNLIRMGLPVPARRAKLYFPQNIFLHLKASGDLRANMSAFSQEMHFFTQAMPDGSYILVDELFQSTDPVGGADLAKLFLHYFKRKNLIFFCTTHYPEVLNTNQVMLYQMLDTDDVNAMLDTDMQCHETFCLETFLARVPFKLRKLDDKRTLEVFRQHRKPLRIALQFPLEDMLKKKIRNKLMAENAPPAAH